MGAPLQPGHGGVDTYASLARLQVYRLSHGGGGMACAADSVLVALLDRYPVARVSALSADGNPAPVPADLPLGPDQERVTSPGLAGYLPEDRTGILIAFDRALRHGVGHASARALHAPGESLSLHLVNMTARHGVVLAISVPRTGGQLSSGRLTQLPEVAPRVARIRKAETATILDIDEATTAILGWTRPEVLGRRSLEFIHPDDQQVAIENWLHLRAHPDVQVRSRLRHRAHGGSWVWMETTQWNRLHTEDCCVLTEMVDISAEMASQAALEAREQLLYQLTQALPLGVFQIDHARRITYTNDRLFDVVGRPRQQNLEQQLAAVAAADVPRLRDAVTAVFGGVSETTLEVDIVDAENTGSSKTCQLILRPLTNDAEEIVGAVGCIADVSEAAQLRKELEHRATFDRLTGCRNWAAIMGVLQSTLDRPSRQHVGTGVVYVDLDHFKSVNDRWGHAAGNDLLVDTAHTLEALFGEATVGRLGGDEFLVVFPSVSASQIASYAQVAEQVLAGDVVLASCAVSRSASIGYAWCAESRSEAEVLVAQADASMYGMKYARRTAGGDPAGGFAGSVVPHPRHILQPLTEACAAPLLDGLQPG